MARWGFSRGECEPVKYGCCYPFFENLPCCWAFAKEAIIVPVAVVEVKHVGTQSTGGWSSLVDSLSG